MTTPVYQSLMLPVLEALGDDKEWPVRELIEHVANRVGISANGSDRAPPERARRAIREPHPLGHDVLGESGLGRPTTSCRSSARRRRAEGAGHRSEERRVGKEWR